MNISFLSFDIDDTILPADESTGFVQKWAKLSFEPRPLLCYNTGRLQDDTLKLIGSRKIPMPDYLICGVGTSIYDCRQKQVIKEFSQILEEGWNRKTVAEVMNGLDMNLEKQPEHFQNAYKSSWYLRDASREMIQEVKKALTAAGLEINVIYSSNLHLDVLPKWADKGNSLEWLLRYLDIEPEQAVVAGNSGNDSAMFNIDGIRGIVVGNAQPELIKEVEPERVYFANNAHQDGVIEGLVYYGASYDDQAADSNDNVLPVQVNLMDIEDMKSITKEQIELIFQGYEEAVKVIKKNITESGFSACSLEDNDSYGTDSNYRSVWARDGSIAITGTIPLIKDPEIHDAQLNTLETLLNNVSPAGQIPSNVSLDTHQPDYSGVGGICSIDSGLWLIIAFHDFVKASGNVDFLRKHFDTLSRVMNWLTAHDGNNDALLEIPEAGDWTDLFGRSYNVLYDEVLWYRANICFGRMLELLGQTERAGDYITWSQVIRKNIIQSFWPTTNPGASSTPHTQEGMTFDERQSSLGDARYLIAQVTPFDFSWRCDVYGNILAYLYNVVDKEKATTTFRFIWGAGVNDPFPVANVYPVVNAGDPDWRPYYTVNLLNLPNHYHNGGIWPFVGGGWVRYINKLGLKELALKELYKLTELNKLGMFKEWEFNEWAHGKTGRPMGKAFQAWSASEFILACHDLNLV